MRRCDFFDTSTGCGLDVVDGIPTTDDCSRCTKYVGPRRGLGDDVVRVVRLTRLDRVVDKVSKGRDCGCGDRMQRLNQLAPAKD